MAATIEDTETWLPVIGALTLDDSSDMVPVSFEVEAEGPVSLSGDDRGLGEWAPGFVALRDDDRDGVWVSDLRWLFRGTTAEYKYLAAEAGEASWDDAEFGGDNRVLRVEDVDGTGSVRVRDVFGVRDGTLLDP